MNGNSIRVIFCILFGLCRLSGSPLFLVYASVPLCDSKCARFGHMRYSVALCRGRALACNNLVGKYIFRTL